MNSMARIVSSKLTFTIFLFLQYARKHSLQHFDFALQRFLLGTGQAQYLNLYIFHGSGEKMIDFYRSAWCYKITRIWFLFQLQLLR